MKFLHEDEKLYTGIKSIKINREGDAEYKITRVSDSWISLSKKPNNALLGLPVRAMPPLKLWVYNYWRKEGKEYKGFNKWFFKNFSKPPILISTIRPDKRAKKLENDLFDKGHFDAKVSYELHDRGKKNKKQKVSYEITLSNPYLYKAIVLKDTLGVLNKHIKTALKETPVKVGEPYDRELLMSEKERITNHIRANGFYYFKPDYIVYNLDTSHKARDIVLEIGIKDKIPDKAQKQYYINDINVFTALGKQKDTLKKLEDCPQCFYDTLNVREEIVNRQIYYESGELFSVEDQRNTATALSNLNVYNGVIVEYVPEDSTDKLNVNINIPPSAPVSMSANVDFLFKSNNYMGPSLIFGYRHENVSKHADKLNVELHGSYDFLVGATGSNKNTRGLYSLNYGINTSYKIPKLLVPTSIRFFNNPYIPYTNVKAMFERANRVGYYAVNNINFNYAVGWKPNEQISQLLTLFEVDIFDLTNSEPQFEEILRDNISLRRSFEQQYSLGAKYNFNKQYSDKKYKKWYFFYDFQLESYGSLANVVHSLSNGETNDEGRKVLFNIPFTQFAKTVNEFRLKSDNKDRLSTLVSRLYVGVGKAFGNSDQMPYNQQFFAGGPYSIRAFQTKSIGPGSYTPTANAGFFDQTGDMRLELNLEYRLRLGGGASLALFADAGNIWLLEKDEQRPGADFQFNRFMSEVALGTGLGIRYDISVLVVRLDYGIALKEPYYPAGKRWIFEDKREVTSALHLVLGYPF